MCGINLFTLELGKVESYFIKRMKMIDLTMSIALKVPWKEKWQTNRTLDSQMNFLRVSMRKYYWLYHSATMCIPHVVEVCNVRNGRIEFLYPSNLEICSEVSSDSKQNNTIINSFNYKTCLNTEKTMSVDSILIIKFSWR